MGTVPEDHSLVLRNNFLPMVTYASMVWWPRVEAKGTKSKLQKLQKLAYLSITGAMSSCPTVALEAMLGLTQLWLEVKRRAAMHAAKLVGRGDIALADHTRHMSILQEIHGLDKASIEY